jgi:hypothetical protein
MKHEQRFSNKEITLYMNVLNNVQVSVYINFSKVWLLYTFPWKSASAWVSEN